MRVKAAESRRRADRGTLAHVACIASPRSAACRVLKSAIATSECALSWSAVARADSRAQRVQKRVAPAHLGQAQRRSRSSVSTGLRVSNLCVSQLNRYSRPRRQMHWFRSRGPGKKNDPAFQKVCLMSYVPWARADQRIRAQCVLAYASDLSFIGTAARAMGLGARTEPRLGMLASLDHAMCELRV